MKNAAREWYEDGVGQHYLVQGSTYRNPHEPIVRECVARAAGLWTLDSSQVLDLACGSGEFTRALIAAQPLANIAGCDPFTFEAYEREVGRGCERLNFEAVADGAMRGRRYSLIGCSFAMHLCQPSLLPQLALELAQISRQLMILTPHKRPAIRDAWGWSLVGELIEQRVRARLYASTLTST